VAAGWLKMLGSAASAVDKAVVAAMHAHGARDRARAEKMTHAQRLEVLAQIHASYSDHDRFFDFSRAIEPTLREVRPGVYDAAWESTFEPYLADVSEKYLAHLDNRTARARLFLRGGKRPVVIAIHGYLGGYYVFEEATWPIAWMQKRGLDVALPVLPFHALRGGQRRGAPPFPSADPRLTNEGFRQAAADIIGLAKWLRERGAPAVGVIGVSLGGYTSSLLATVSTRRESEATKANGGSAFDFVVPMIPLASVADFAREQGRLGIGDEVEEQHAALEKANWIVSPLARPLKVQKSRALVIAAENDCITPSSHAKRLAAHFDCEMMTIAGGHLVQIGRGDAYRAFGKMLVREGIISPR
jgi:pimeloyl-ACP methyl ester carboxylesterase